MSSALSGFKQNSTSPSGMEVFAFFNEALVRAILLSSARKLFSSSMMNSCPETSFLSIFATLNSPKCFRKVV